MRVSELVRYSRKLLKHRRGRVLLLCLLPFGADVAFRSAEAAMCCLVLYFGSAAPAELFSGSSPELAACSAVCGVLRIIFCPPLLYGVTRKLVMVSGDTAAPPLADMLTNLRFVRRSIAAELWCRGISIAAALPAVASGGAFCRILLNGGGEDALFGLLVTGALTAAMAVMWLCVRLSLAAVPFLTVMEVRRSALRTALFSLRFLSGRRSLLAKLCAVYFIPLAALVGIPFLLPELMTAFNLCLSIFLMEDQYGGRSRSFRISGTGGLNERDTA